MNFKNLIHILLIKDDIIAAIENYNDAMDNLEVGFYINSFEDLAFNSKIGKKFLYHIYNKLLYIGLNKIIWCGGNIDYYEVYYNLKDHSITYKKFN